MCLITQSFLIMLARIIIRAPVNRPLFTYFFELHQNFPCLYMIFFYCRQMDITTMISGDDRI